MWEIANQIDFTEHLKFIINFSVTLLMITMVMGFGIKKVLQVMSKFV